MTLASSPFTPVAAFADPRRRLAGVMLEVLHTEQGQQL